MKKIFLMIAAAVLLTACSGNDNKFCVEGTIEGASDTTVLLLEESSNGNWLIIDSVDVDKNGHFELYSDAPSAPNVYRLRWGNQTICFPIDSLDHLKLKAKLANFASDYTLSGSKNAEQMMKIDKKAMWFANGNGTPEEYNAWKDELSRQIAADTKNIVAYYTIFKQINGRPLFDPSDNKDLRLIGAVANAFHEFRPNDPRTNYLEKMFLSWKSSRLSSTMQNTVYADVTSLIEIKLQDYRGTEHSLQDVSGKNHVVLLNFTAYQAEFSPQLNKLLNDIYKSSTGLAIYQVSLDADNVAWREAAKNLPWITVYDPDGIDSRNVLSYNLYGIPTTFIICNGEIVERVEDATKLKEAVAKYI